MLDQNYWALLPEMHIIEFFHARVKSQSQAGKHPVGLPVYDPDDRDTALAGGITKGKIGVSTSPVLSKVKYFTNSIRQEASSIKLFL
jgi:hypothetical protein